MDYQNGRIEYILSIVEFEINISPKRTDVIGDEINTQ